MFQKASLNQLVIEGAIRLVETGEDGSNVLPVLVEEEGTAGETIVTTTMLVVRIDGKDEKLTVCKERYVDPAVETMTM